MGTRHRAGGEHLVVNCGPTNADFLNAVNVAANYPSVSVVSMSLGGTESQGELANDSYFTNPTNHDGINVSFVASSGDDKSAQGPGPLYPSVSPNVLAVGGTVLALSSNGNSEVSWPDSEGGQTSNGQSTVLDWHTPQGDSLGAPQWAALIAIANQGRTLEGEPTLSNVPQKLYSLSPNDFNDITSGPANREGYSPGPGYDEITGLGTPKADKLVPALVNQPLTLPPWILHELQLLDGFGSDFNDFNLTPQDRGVMAGSLASSALNGLGQFPGLNSGSLLPVDITLGRKPRRIPSVHRYRRQRTDRTAGASGRTERPTSLRPAALAHNKA
jgi:hypothetical protein